MLVQKTMRIWLTGLLLLYFAIGCQHSVRTIPKVELLRTPEIRINLKNETSGNLRILPAQDQSADASINLTPGTDTQITFSLVKIANLEKTNHSWMRPVKGSETNMIVTNDPVRYIDVQGEDGLIRMRNAQGRLWKLLLDIQSCLEHQNVVDEIVITGLPDPVVPTALCE